MVRRKAKRNPKRGGNLRKRARAAKKKQKKPTRVRRKARAQKKAPQKRPVKAAVPTVSEEEE